MKKLITTLLLTAASISATSAWAIDLSICQGGPEIASGVVSCTVEKTIDSDDHGQPLAAATFGIVKSVDVSANLSFEPGKLNEYLQEHQLSIPAQTISFAAQTSGSPITLNVTLAPSLTIAEQNGKPVATDANVGVSAVTGSLPTWVNNYIKQALNANRLIKSALVSGANKGLSRL